jgi:hypothetical protein
MPPAHRTAGYRRGMQHWQAIPAPVGGVVAVGFLDEDRIVGSHSGVGVFDVHAGARIERTHDENHQPDFRIEDSEDYPAQGFSPGGGAFVYATSPTVNLVTRRT